MPKVKQVSQSDLDAALLGIDLEFIRGLKRQLRKAVRDLEQREKLILKEAKWERSRRAINQEGVKAALQFYQDLNLTKEKAHEDRDAH